MRNPSYDEIADELRIANLALARGVIDDDTRAAAMNALCRDYARTNDREVCAVLASIVKNRSASTCIRFFAYVALFEISDRPVDEFPSVAAFFSDPFDLDWRFVDQWL